VRDAVEEQLLTPFGLRSLARRSAVPAALPRRPPVDAEEPFTPHGCIAQAWSVAEVLRAWRMTSDEREWPRAPATLAGEDALALIG
jgi:glycogen debranching enzyme